MPTDKSILSFRATAMADPLSAAPPMIARNTMPMKICDMPSASHPAFRDAHQNFAHPCRQHRRAAEAEDGAWHAPTFAVVVRFILLSFNARERAGMRLKGKEQIESVGQQQHGGDSEIEQLFLPYRTFRCELAAERA